jgi:hypothetical protein
MALARYWQTDEDVQEAQGELSKLQAEERVMLKRILDRAAPKDGWGYSW